ncbi:hypothetical protein GCM10010425_00310 [Streptomyces spororaveus]|uniref:Secreted protein n=1 Tax=Streptomyces spororaveus TaxID=284039 RepID=A0ABQ3TCE8_9ACTN|nr:hypothetical protein [Streptomyces spororaveus]MCM9081517.1 hypothetical protein [Streptomyces spororaveus]GHI78049.1 hypothetical protein Sspor_36100 [Streptomyces spororaveus]
MSIRHMVKVRGGMAVAGAAAVMVLTLAGCGGEGAKEPKADGKAPTAQPQGGGSNKPTSKASPSPQPTETLATANGDPGIVLTINSAVRDPGGFVTVSGQIKNDGSGVFTKITAWRGDEKSASGASIAGATLIDKVGKKRYYVLRDSENCLCTTGITRIDPGASIPIFAQFPAPPASSTEVDFTLPTFATATIRISG